MSREIKFRVWFPQDAREGKPAMGMVHSSYEGQSLNDFLAEVQEIGIILMQFTGLRDKNGHEIYEGDILRTQERWVDKDGRLSSVRVQIQVVEWTGEYVNSHYWHEFYEVIGNIYENPELLEGKHV